MTEQRYTTEALGWGAGGERPEAPAAEPFKPLTDEEIAELRRLDSDGESPPWEALGDNNIETPGRWALYESDGVGMRDGNRRLTIAARNALPRLLDFAEKARALLRRIQSNGRVSDRDDPNCGADACPECEGLVVFCAAHREGLVTHKPDCELAALLGAK